MAQDEKATFAARLGNGRASLGVFPGKNIVLVGGDRISMDDSGALASVVWTVMGYFFMAMGVMFVISILLKKKNLFSLRQNEGA